MPTPILSIKKVPQHRVLCRTIKRKMPRKFNLHFAIHTSDQNHARTKTKKEPYRLLYEQQHSLKVHREQQDHTTVVLCIDDFSLRYLSRLAVDYLDIMI